MLGVLTVAWGGVRVCMDGGCSAGSRGRMRTRGVLVAGVRAGEWACRPGASRAGWACARLDRKSSVSLEGGRVACVYP